MKKKLIAIAIAAVVAAPLTAQAGADLSGDARYRLANSDTGLGTDNRVRVKINVDNGNISAHTRMTADATGASMMTADYAYLTFKATDALTLTVGDQLSTWGTKIFAEGTLVPSRLKAAYKVSNQFTALATIDPYANANGDTSPGVSLLAVFKMSNTMTAGAVLRMKKDTATPTDATNNIFVKGQMSGITFGFESDSAKTTADGSSDRANYLMLGMKAGGADLALHYLDASGHDTDFSPLGIVNGTPTIGSGALNAGTGGAAKLMVVTAKMAAAGGNVTVGAGTSDAGSVGTSETLMGIDYAKKMGNAMFSVNYGSFNSVGALGMKIETKF